MNDVAQPTPKPAAGSTPGPARRGPNYAFVVVAVVFLTLLAGAGLRATPGVLLQPFERAFGWTRSQTSLAAAVGIFLYGMVGPFAAALMQSFGIRRMVVFALLLMAASAGGSAFMTEHWHLVLTWGVLSGVASGCVAQVLGATVVNRWFVARRGLIMGILAASTATGSLIFIPGIAKLTEVYGWQRAVFTLAACALALIPLVLALLVERPSDVGLLPYGATEAPEPPLKHGNPFVTPLEVLARAVQRRDFWLLFATFFICGATTNGLVGTHLISLCGDNGIPEVRAAGLLATMGVFDLIGTTGSGWLTDRFDPRKLLFMYYSLRGLSLIWLPYSDFSLYSLSIFSVFYGLDWLATVPPTLRLTNETFGEDSGPIVFGWVVAGHQIGAASTAMVAGLLRTIQGNYAQSFALAGTLGVLGGGLALLIGARSRDRAAAAHV